jgi:Spy/CpxP family protein refolding chaperone
MNDKVKQKMKLMFAGAAACACVGFAVWMGYSYFVSDDSNGPSSLTLNPEDQEQIVAERRAFSLKEKLNLTEEQTDKVTEIVMQMRDKVRDARAENAGNMAGLMTMRRTMMDEFEKKVMPILTPEQQKLFKEGKEDAGGRFQQLQQFRERFGNQSR